MKRTRSVSRTPFGLWAESTATALATLTTLAVRVPQLMTGTMTGPESRRMVAEKVEAAREGGRNAAVAAGWIALRPPRRPSMKGLVADAVTVLDAASGPVRRTVKANAKRLSRPRTRKTG